MTNAFDFTINIPSLGVMIAAILWLARIEFSGRANAKAIDKTATKVDAISDSLSKHKLHAAETFATKDGMTETMRDVRASVDKLSGRIDDLIAMELRQAASQKGRHPAE
jgi:hypothetical protein